MQLKGSEPPDSPPPPYPGYAQHADVQHGGLHDAYYQQPPGGAYPNYDPSKPQPPPPQGPYSAHPAYYTPQQHQQQQQQQQGTQQVTSPRHVIIAQPQSMSGVVEMVPHKPKSYLALSMVTCLCFSPLFGLIAICFSAASHSAYEHGDILTAKRHGTTALLLCIFGIVLSLVILVIVLTAGVQWKPD